MRSSSPRAAGSSDEKFMVRALALAKLGLGTAQPNPLVGAVVVRDGRVIGQAFHHRAGEAHAEALALASAGARGRGATLYTNLEPCCHTGRTPPCVDEILRAGIRRVVAAMRDPNPRVNGGGFRRLRRHGVRVEVGLLRAKARELNSPFIKKTHTGLPFVTLKGAMSLDGRIATRTGDSKWITSGFARRHARLLRYEHDAILVGIGTVLADDPRLNRRPRLTGASPLLRVVADGELRIPLKSRLVESAREEPLLVLSGTDAEPSRRRRLEDVGVHVQPIPRRRGKLDLEVALRALGDRGVTSVLVEGGGELHGSFLSERLADRIVVYIAPTILGGDGARPLIAGEGVDLVRDAIELPRPRSAPLGSGWMVEGSLAAG